MTSPVIKCCFLCLTLAVAGSISAAAENPPEVDPAIAEMAAVDADLARFERFLKQYDNPRDMAYVGEIFEVLKSRVEAVRADFDQLKADDLRFDINTQAQRLARAMAPLDTPLPKNESVLNLEELNPSPSARAEVNAALAALDGAIARKEREAKARQDGRDAALAKIGQLKKSRAELARNFTTAAWIATVKQLNRE
jgi:uncharacterized small protein (DUF1192 family)